MPETMGHLKKMVNEYNFFPLAVRADSIGYYIIFESSDQANKIATACFNRFKSTRFRGQKMNMKLYKTGEGLPDL